MPEHPRKEAAEGSCWTEIHPQLSPQTPAFAFSDLKSDPSPSSRTTTDALHAHADAQTQTLAPESTTPESTTIGHIKAEHLPDHGKLLVDSQSNNGSEAVAPLGADSVPAVPVSLSDESNTVAEPLSSTASSIENLTALPKKSFREHRTQKHRKSALSIDSIPRQTILKALQSQRSKPAHMQGQSSIAGMLENGAEMAHDVRRGVYSDALAHHRFDQALSELDLNSESLSASKMAALASPCFFHKKFDHAVNIERVLEEVEGDETISHSRLMQTATSVREVSKQLQRRPIKMTVRNVMIVTKARDNQLVHLTRELAEWLLCTPRNGADVGVNVYVDHKLRNSKRFDMPSLLAKDTRFKEMLRFWTPDLCWTSPEKFDLVLTLGGDGTVLYTSWLFQRIVPPILSFSLGSLGFLTNFEFDQYKDALNKIMGDVGMRVNLRMRFTCTVYRYQPHAPEGSSQHIEAEQFEVLNELVIDRGPSPYVSNLELYGDNHLLTVVQADGCIFSTPTGSTAYSLSAGGSLVHPDIPAILLTPICPHTLSFRPMMLNDSMLLRVAVPRNSRATAYCAFDGKGRVELRQGDHVTIAASQYPFPSVLSKPNEWFDSISRTLRWNTRGAMQKAWDGDEQADSADAGFDIDFADDGDPDSGYSAEGSSAGGRDSPIRKGMIMPFA